MLGRYACETSAFGKSSRCEFISVKRGLAPSGQTVVTPRFSWRIAPVRKAAATSSFDIEPDLQMPGNAGRIRIRMSQPCVEVSVIAALAMQGRED